MEKEKSENSTDNAEKVNCDEENMESSTVSSDRNNPRLVTGEELLSLLMTLHTSEKVTPGVTTVGLVSYRDKTTIYFRFIYHIAFWFLENSTTLLAPNECQIPID